MVIVVLPAGAFDASRHDLESRLGSSGGSRVLLQLTEDDEGGSPHVCCHEAAIGLSHQRPDASAFGNARAHWTLRSLPLLSISIWLRLRRYGFVRCGWPLHKAIRPQISVPALMEWKDSF